MYTRRRRRLRRRLRRTRRMRRRWRAWARCGWSRRTLGEQSAFWSRRSRKALLDARFYFTMQEGNAALHTNDLATAQYEFHSALQMHPSSAEATLGMGDTLLKGQHASAAIAVFDSYAKMRPEDVAGWRGLLMSYFGAEQYTDALALDGRVPQAVHGEAMRDPDYLRTLASVYSALGREAEAQRVLQIALDLPFPVSGRGAKADTQLQYAGLLLAAKRYE